MTVYCTIPHFMVELYVLIACFHMITYLMVKFVRLILNTLGFRRLFAENILNKNVTLTHNECTAAVESSGE